MKRLCCALFCALLLLIPAACSSGVPETSQSAAPEVTTTAEDPTQTAPPETETAPELPAPLDPAGAPKLCLQKVYALSMPTEDGQEETVYLDEQGAIVEQAAVPDPVYDILSGKLRYYLYRQEAGGQEISWLYSASGKALEGSADCVYGDCVGTSIVKQLIPDPADPMAQDAGWLVDPEKGTVLRENVHSVLRLSNDRALYLDAKRHILGVYTATGKQLFADPFEGEFTVGYCCGPYVLGYPETGCAVLNEDLEVLDTSPKMFDMDLIDCGGLGVFCIKKQEIQTDIIEANGWKLIGSFSGNFQGTDGICAICGDVSGTGVKLFSVRGKRLAGPFEKLTPLYDETGTPTGRYLARTEKTISILSKGGEELCRRKISGLQRAYAAEDGMFLAEYEFENYWTEEKQTGLALLNDQLRRITSDERNYLEIRRVAEGIYAVRRQNSESGYRTDLIGLDGESFFSKVRSVGDGDGTVIAVYRDGSYGLIDRNGEWVARTRLNGDDEEE